MAKLRLRIEGKSVAQSLSNGIVTFPQVETKATF
jgi:hypothetical protein